MRGNTRHHPRMADAVLAPALAGIGEIEQHRHGAVGGVGKTRLIGFTILEFLPQRHVAHGMGVRQQTKNTLHRQPLRRLAFGQALVLINNRVAGVDLADVVYQQHAYHTVNVHWHMGVMHQ